MNVTKGRYAPQPDGSVYDTWGGYYIDAALWNQWMAEGRSDRADHDFQLGMRAEEVDVPAQWHRVHAACSICGEQRLVFHGVNMADLNRGWCISRPPRESFVRRLWRALAP